MTPKINRFCAQGGSQNGPLWAGLGAKMELPLQPCSLFVKKHAPAAALLVFVTATVRLIRPNGLKQF